MNELTKVLNGESLNQEQTYKLFNHLIAGQLSDTQIAGMLMALKIKGETPEELAGAAQALRQAAKPFPRPKGLLADTCGTGGDGSNTINISTSAGLVAAAMGVPVAKHGNRSVSSRSGSADVLEALSIPLEGSPDDNRKLLDQHGFCFLFAPHYHPGVRYAMPARQALKTRTLFNLLGPLINPAQPDVQLLGVYKPELCAPVAETLKLLNCPRAMVVHGSGLDELALHDETIIAELNQGEIIEYTVTPEDFGVQRASVNDLKGGDAERNAQFMKDVFAGKGRVAHRDAIAMNVGAILYMTQRATTLKAGTAEAISFLDSGQALTHLQQFQAELCL
ncbi:MULTISPECIES: anthranilate phosphoribosyltransferase [Gammaproteobacteria]|uniref:anthranilate phosphoribosyltransferase n=1 Tax=Gammaproteobacteria TaxID=1236 RepID=UPI000DD0B453|nr:MULTISPECIES: anthranilate phosphoribosyltransferase [Gammaproteobacteria]RTE87569.1 anthranilate phosphoribosyltransferase [Aliidiomarina sp. B3213]TCZ92647.1 anthranilate phosphoribosyltransferase [Lysobacter sp. N42]